MKENVAKLVWETGKLVLDGSNQKAILLRLSGT